MKKWARANYQPGLPLYGGQRVTASAAHIGLSKQAALDGMVLLKNEGKILPLKSGQKAVLLGKGSFDYVKGGGGSGDVYTKYVRSVYDGLSECGVELYAPVCDFYRDYVKARYNEGMAPGMMPEAEISETLLEEAAAYSDTAILCFSRFSGEGWDRSDVEYEAEPNPWGNEVSMPKTAGRIFPKGDFYLTETEEKLVETVCERFSKVIAVLNIGGVVDTKWIRDNSAIGAALICWQGGMEGGTAAAAILTGRENPCGKLPDTFAGEIGDYPSTENFHESPHYVDYTEDIFVGYRYFETFESAKPKVVYPFGYGLSYTTFKKECVIAVEEEKGFRFGISVENTGNAAGKEVTAIYASAPQGSLGKPAKILVAFEKTPLLAPGESKTLELYVEKQMLASFDDLGKVADASFVLEAGTYRFFLGGDVENARELDFTYVLSETKVVEKLSHQLTPVSLKKRLKADGTYEELPQGPEKDINECIFEKLTPGSEEAMVPAVRGRASYMLMHPYREGVKPLMEVHEGKMTVEEFLAQMTDEDLIELLGGQPNVGVSNTWGMGNEPEYGVPNVTTADGPAGVRLNQDCGIFTTAWPCATTLAATWNKELVYEVGRAGGEELKENNLQIWLTPAVNIHRSPLCGRNFEYYSEDPLLAGKMGAALVKGIQSLKVAACPKHFAANNKETNRKHSDSRVSERALREIYLKPFEIIVKEADPWIIMSAYNAINGQRASESRELLTGILREEWGYQGAVTSDWWNRAEHYKEILAGNDVKMAMGYPERVKAAMEKGALTRDDLLSCARHVVEMILKLD